MKFILILTLYAQTGYDGGPTITQVNGFQTREACITAGNEWLKQVNPINAVDWARALCVPTGG